MNVRWDAVVERGASGRRPKPASPAPGGDHPTVAVHVWPYGVLNARVAQRPIVLELRDGFTLREAFAALARRHGAALLEGVLDRAGNKFRHCRVFVEGEPVEDMDARVPCPRTPARMELILLVAAEGG